MSTLGQRKSELVRACFTGVWIKSYEPEDAIAELAQLCRSENWSLMTWDIAQGLRATSEAAASAEPVDPIGALKTLSAVSHDDTPTILVLRSYHRFLGIRLQMTNGLVPRSVPVVGCQRCLTYHLAKRRRMSFPWQLRLRSRFGGCESGLRADAWMRRLAGSIPQNTLRTKASMVQLPDAALLAADLPPTDWLPIPFT